MLKKWKKSLVELDSKLSESGARQSRKKEMTTDSIDIDALMPKFIENIRRENEQNPTIESDMDSVDRAAYLSNVRLTNATRSKIDQPIVEEEENLDHEYADELSFACFSNMHRTGNHNLNLINFY